MNQHPLHICYAVLGALLALGGDLAAAAKIGDPAYDLRVWGIRPTDTSHPLDLGSGSGVLLGAATDQDAVNGGVTITRNIGFQSSGADSFVQAGVANDGDLFAIIVDTPVNFRRASYDYIGSAAEVLVYQSYRKDSADAKLTYTYSFANVFAFMNPEFGPICPTGDPYCMRAEMISTASVVTNPTSNASVWSRLDSAMVTTQPGFPSFASFVVGDWPWDIVTSPGGGDLGNTVEIPAPVTREVDLSGIQIGEEFTVWYQLYGYAYDRGSHLGLRRGASVFARDPLAGDTGVAFDLVGLTPTNNPIVPIPEPRTWALLLTGLGLTVLAASRRKG